MVIRSIVSPSSFRPYIMNEERRDGRTAMLNPGYYAFKNNGETSETTTLYCGGAFGTTSASAEAFWS